MLDNYWLTVVNNIQENADDFDELKIIYLLVKDQIYRLQGDLNNDSIKKEYNTLVAIELQLRDIINNYV